MGPDLLIGYGLAGLFALSLVAIVVKMLVKP